MFHRKQTKKKKNTTHAHIPDHTSVLRFGGDNYWLWHGMFKSYKTLKESSPAYKDKKRLAYMRNQIILHYVKNFFLFPIWFISLLIPSYMKGEVNVWTNIRTMWHGLMSREFKPLRIAILSQLVFLFFIVQFGITVFYKNATPTYAATYTFTQSSWNSSASTTANAVHPDNSTGWAYYYTASSTISASSDVRLSAITASTTRTSDTDFGGATTSSAEISGSGDSASVVLTSTADEIYDWIQPDGTPDPPSMTYVPSCTFYTSNSDYIYVFDPGYGIRRYTKSTQTWSAIKSIPATSGNTAVSCTEGYLADGLFFVLFNNGASKYFYEYNVETNSWTSRGANAESASGYGSALIYDKDKTSLYYFPSESTISFYRYTLYTGWTTLTATTTLGTGAWAIQRGDEDKMYVILGGNTANFYEYTPSTNQWNQLPDLPTNANYGAQLLRDGTSNDIYLLPGGNSPKIYKYDIALASWDETLADAPGNIYYGSWAVRNGAADNIYVGRSSNSTDFFTYSISGDSWTTSTIPYTLVNNDGHHTAVLDTNDNKIYIVQGNSNGNVISIYEPSGETWVSSVDSSIETPPVPLSFYRAVKDGDYIFYFYSTGLVYRYTISTGDWTQMPTAPASSLKTNDLAYDPTNHKVYILRGASGAASTDFYSYDLLEESDPWTKLHNCLHTNYSWTVYVPPVVVDGYMFLQHTNGNYLERYDISADSWEDVDTLPTYVPSIADTVNENYLYASYTTGLYRFDIDGAAAWETISTSAPGTGKLFLDAAGENIFLQIQTYASGYYSTNMHQYNIASGEWTDVSNYPIQSTQIGYPVLFPSGESNDVMYGLLGQYLYTYTISTGVWASASVGLAPLKMSQYSIVTDWDNHSIYAAAGSDVYKYITATLTYDTPGTYTSAVIDNGPHAGYTTLDYSTTLNSQTITVDVRAGDSSDTGDGSWTSWLTGVSDGGDISSLGSHRYVQYKLNMSTSDVTKTPTFDDITVNFNKYTSGELISSPYDTSDSANVLAGVSWTGTTSTSEVVKFQLRTSADGNTWTDWMGSDGTSGTYLTASDGSDDISGTDIGDGTDDQWIQYKATLTSTGSSTPILDTATMTYVVNATPEVQNVTASQNSDGTVSITYEVRDADTSTGATPGYILPTVEYYNGSTWVEASTLSANATSSKAVDQTTFNSYALTWYPNTDFDEQYLNSSTGQIRVKANDSEAANNIGTGTSANFALDTKKPVKTSFSIDARTGTSPNLTLVASDDTMAGLEIIMSNASSALGTDNVNASSGIWMAYDTEFDWNFSSNPNTVYYQFRDATGNTSTVYSSTAPQTPQNPVYRDISNSETSEWREFIAWETVANPTPGFKQYNIYRSTDGETFNLLSTETDRTVNYYLDTGLDPETTYYYKVTAEDDDDNISNYSTTISDSPNGQGGSDFTSPTITNVASSNIGPETATITWDTDEPSNSTVEYITETGGVFDDAESVGIATMLDTTSGLGQHTVVLSGLQPNTTYYYQVKSTDPSTNIGTSKDGVDGYSFTTLSGPTIAEISATDIRNQQATISWQTDSVATSYVYYSTSSAMTNPTQTGSVDETTSHSVTITGLSADTQYYYYVKSGAASDKNVIDGQITYYSFITTNDQTGPLITFNSNTDITNLSDTGVTISWTTDQAATSTLEYGLSTSYGTTRSNDLYNTNHVYTLTSLDIGTTYYVRLKNTDGNGNTSTSTEFTFTTTDSTDVTAPTVSSVTTTLVSDVKAVVTWTTDEGSSSQVFYGTSENILPSSSTIDTASNVNHTVVISDLTANTTYYYYVKSADANDNTTTSTVQSFTTLETLSTETEVTTREATSYQEGYNAAPRGGGGGMIIINPNSDKIPPDITENKVTSITDTSATITWTANENSDGVVEYGLAQNSLEKTEIEIPRETLQISHRVFLSDLTPLTTYYYRVTSADKNHNVSAPLTGSFTTTLTSPDGTVIDTNISDSSETSSSLESVYLASLQRAGDIIRSMSSQVSVGVLESTLLEQNNLINDLAKILPTPIISGQAVVEAGSTYVTISWLTDKESNSLVDIASDEAYRATDKYEQTVGDSTAAVVSHVVNIRGLRPNTLYHYSLISRTPTGVEAKSKDFTFRTKAETSEITTYKAKTLSETETRFSWITNVPTDSTITYTPYTNGVPNKSAAQVVHDNSYTTDHALIVTGLEAGVVYDIELSGQDYGKSTVSKLIQGYTTDGEDLPPIVYQIQTDSSILPGANDKIQVIISWMTNELSTSRVLYRKGFSAEDDFTESTTLDQNYIRKHITVITNFEPGSVYQFQVESTDSAGNTTRSKTVTILTPRKQESVFQVIMGNFQSIFSWVGKIQG